MQFGHLILVSIKPQVIKETRRLAPEPECNEGFFQKPHIDKFECSNHGAFYKSASKYASVV
jgi:hypothetical protein